MLKAVCGHVIAADSLMKIAWLSDFVCGGSVVVGGLYLLYSIYADLAVQTRMALFSFLPVLLVLPFPRVSNAICGNVLRAAGDTKSSMNISLGANWLFMVPATALCVLVFNLSVTWVFALFLLEEFVKFPFFHSRIWKKEWYVRKG